jgi:hypothetical protein
MNAVIADDSSDAAESVGPDADAADRGLLDALIDVNAGKVHRMASALPLMLRRWR